MKLSLTGIERIDYTSRKTGQQVTGTKLYGIEQPLTPVEGLVGNRTVDAYVGNKIALPPLTVGDVINVYYNQRGGIDAIVPEPKSPATK